MEWDWKRKLVNPKDITIVLDGTAYTHISCKTSPYKNLEEYNTYKTAAANIKLLKTECDYHSFLITLANQHCNTRNTVSTNKNIARSILRYIRSGQLEGFEDLTGVEIIYRISMLLDEPLTSNDYKKAKLKERNKYVLSHDVIAPYTKELGLSWVDQSKLIQP